MMSTLKVVMCFLGFVQTIDAKKYRVVIDDELYPYTIDPTVPYYLEYFNSDNMRMEQIDDDQVELGGYAVAIKSFSLYLPLQITFTTQYMENSVWREGPLQFIVPNVCTEFLKPSRFWYNITKLWTNCPPKKGEKWMIESQIINIDMVLPPSLPKGHWRAFMLFKQGAAGSITKYGFMAGFELIDIV